jgi:hypothetical protein
MSGTPGRWARLRAAAAALLIAAALTIRAAPAAGTQQRPVWFWFATCGGPAMDLRVQAGGATVYEASFPVCRAQPNSPESQGQTSRVRFFFRSAVPIRWLGYRGQGETTPPGQPIECDLWQAGAEENELLIGVSFVSGDVIYTNTVVVASPYRKRRTTVARGVVISIGPAPLSGAGR